MLKHLHLPHVGLQILILVSDGFFAPNKRLKTNCSRFDKVLGRNSLGIQSPSDQNTLLRWLITHPNHPLTKWARTPKDSSKPKKIDFEDVYLEWRICWKPCDDKKQISNVVHHDATTPTIHTTKVTKTFSMNPWENYGEYESEWQSMVPKNCINNQVHMESHTSTNSTSTPSPGARPW